MSENDTYTRGSYRCLLCGDQFQSVEMAREHVESDGNPWGDRNPDNALMRSLRAGGNR